MEGLKPHFLATSQHYEEFGEYGRQYAGFLTFAALDPGDTFTRQEMRDATGRLPADGLCHAVRTLVQALEGAGDRRIEYWRNRVVPYLKYVWPKSQDILTPAIAVNFARLCIAAGNDFPAAFRTLRPWLRFAEDPGSILHSLREAKLCGRFPFDALMFLDVVISDKASWTPDDLKECLDDIQGADAMLEADPHFQRLLQILRRQDVR
jgi:hypothetical protein